MRICTIPKDAARIERFDVRYAPEVSDLLEFFEELRNEKAIIFVPSRRDVETLTAALVTREHTAWAHHSAISASSRRDTETAIREAPRGLLIATSTFELGIDIGDLDRIAQIDAPATVSAMIQRLGRTGRRAGAEAKMTFLVRKTEPLVLALALLHLHAQGWIEPLESPAKPFIVLIQQILANLIQTGGMPKALLVSRLAANAAFAKLTHDDVLRFVDALVETNAIEAVDERLHLGSSTERRFGHRNFGELASLFTSDPVVCFDVARRQASRDIAQTKKGDRRRTTRDPGRLIWHYSADKPTTHIDARQRCDDTRCRPIRDTVVRDHREGGDHRVCDFRLYAKRRFEPFTEQRNRGFTVFERSTDFAHVKPRPIDRRNELSVIEEFERNAQALDGRAFR
jgi:hypothetical protein